MSILALDTYYSEISQLLTSDGLFEKLATAQALVEAMNQQGGRLILAGNGGSAGIVAHAAVDFTKQAQIPAMTFNETALITAFSNDYGYEHWVQKAFEFYALPNDVLVCVSVSGTSANLVNASKYAKANNHKVITFSGRSADNSLRQLGDVNFWVDSNAYNIVEGLHMIWLTSIVDMILGKSVYEVS